MKMMPIRDELEGSAAHRLRIEIPSRLDEVLRHDGGTREGHVDLEGPRHPIQIELDVQIVERYHLVDRLDLRAVGVARIRVENALEGIDHVFRGQRLAVVEGETPDGA